MCKLPISQECITPKRVKADTRIEKYKQEQSPVYQEIQGNTLLLLIYFAGIFILPQNRKIPPFEEQGNELVSLDFPEKISAWRTEAHDGQPSGRTLFGRAPFSLLLHNDL